METMQIKAKKRSIQAVVQPQKKYERTSSLQKNEFIILLFRGIPLKLKVEEARESKEWEVEE